MDPGGPGPPQDDLRAPPGDPQDPSETHLGPPWAALGPPRAPLGGDGLAQTAKTMILLKLSFILRSPGYPARVILLGSAAEAGHFVGVGGGGGSPY